MKKIVVASDSFKGTLSSSEICEIAKRVIPDYFPECEVFAVPVADGGEGTVDCFLKLGAKPVKAEVSGPFFEKIEAVYARLGKTAVIEMSAAAGLPLAGENKNPELATTYGVGQLIKHAVDQGCSRILLGLGGSATNDGGCGMAAALGAVFRDSKGKEFIPTGGTLGDIHAISLREIDKYLADVYTIAMCDVDSPLGGKNGAAYVYGLQKGADSEMVKRLDKGLERLSSYMTVVRGEDISDYPGAGAAGGMGAGCMWFLKGVLRPGTEAVLDAVGFDSALKGADYVITGEGRLDSQSLKGKLLSGVKKRAGAAGVPVVVIAGSIKKGDDGLFKDLRKIYTTSDYPAHPTELRRYAKINYERTLRSFCEDVLGGKV